MPETSEHLVHRSNKDDLVKRLNRIEGQVRGISKMISEDKYCVDILNQIAAARAALDQVGLIILEGHVRGCVVRGIKEANEDAIVTELLDVIKRFV